ncbi:hypothetical protein V500_09690 [Pseudogymnoascus sp. VKM F-4518 (FW-2643)]|nr:hypothetical protein V500_09690 [Pseudogymnoascus sp. VKM F-4518 (FW-2643)]
MASVQLQTLDQQGSSSAASSSISPSVDTRSRGVAETSLPKTSVYSPRPSLQQQQQQQQQQPSQERRRPQRQATLEETDEATQQLPTQAQQGPQGNGDRTLSFPWSKFIKRITFIVTVLAFILGIGMIAPTVGQYATGVWSAAKDYQDWCKGEQSVNKTLTDICELVVDQPLPPPPGLNQVFKDIRPRGAESAVPSIWNLLTDEWKAFRAFLRTPVGACLATMLFSYGMLAVGFKGQDIELMIGSISVNYLTEGVWFMLFRVLFLGLSFAWKPWFTYTSGYVFLLADWAFWVQDQGLKEPSWVSRAVLLTLTGFLRFSLPNTFVTMKGDNTASAESSSSSSSSTSKWSKVAAQTPEETEAARLLDYHLSLLRLGPSQKGLQDVTTAPIFSMPVLEHAESKAVAAGDSSPAFPQYGLLAGMTGAAENESQHEETDRPPIRDPRIFFNVAAPSSTFICGSQGSGKSHTLSCLLENCLIPSNANKLPRPLTGLVFHYDLFISDEGGSPCEAAYLSSDPNIKVRVLCSPTNVKTIKGTYNAFKNVTVEPLRISEENLNTKRMLDLMAVSRGDGPMPLYLHAVYRILREMRIEQQETGTGFSYSTFKDRIARTEMTPAQLSPLTQRLDTLESFMPNSQTGAILPRRKGKPVRQYGNDWTSEPGSLTIVDLSCPCVTSEGACSLFNICLSIFLEQDMTAGRRVIALDEAHKFMNESAEAQTLTATLLTTIRLQRHLGARIIISTQEPTISPDLLDLCSVTIVHRFTSPDWMKTLKAHLAAAASDMTEPEQVAGDQVTEPNPRAKGQTASVIFTKIVELEVGEALLFSPSAMVGVDVASNGGWYARLGAGVLKVRVRSRLTTDGGKSILAA